MNWFWKIVQFLQGLPYFVWEYRDPIVSLVLLFMCAYLLIILAFQDKAKRPVSVAWMMVLFFFAFTAQWASHQNYEFSRRAEVALQGQELFWKAERSRFEYNTTWELKTNCLVLESEDDCIGVWEEHLPTSESGEFHMGFDGEWVAGAAPSSTSDRFHLPGTWKKSADKVTLFSASPNASRYCFVRKAVLPPSDDETYHLTPHVGWEAGSASAAK